jgi:hypothetical protein
MDHTTFEDTRPSQVVERSGFWYTLSVYVQLCCETQHIIFITNIYMHFIYRPKSRSSDTVGIATGFMTVRPEFESR